MMIMIIEYSYVISMWLDIATFEEKLPKNGVLFCTTSENVFFIAESQYRV